MAHVEAVIDFSEEENIEEGLIDEGTGWMEGAVMRKVILNVATRV